jgi:myo-inositol 2-dehydrogenase/D-chiro-inositol 1-dehydrogenase
MSLSKQLSKICLSLETVITVMKIGQALQQALLTGEVTRFNESGERLN